MTAPAQGSAQAGGGFRSVAVTHPGVLRTENQDAFLNRPDLGLWAVADGAGGHQDGAAAAQAVIGALDTIPTGLTAAEVLAQLRLRLDGVHDRLVNQAGAIMATTVVVLVARGGYFACLWAGDSRAYRLRDGKLARLTRDHSVVQALLDAGEISAAEAERHPEAHVIIRAIGGDLPEPGLEKIVGVLADGDRFLLCSDGISKSLDDAVLAGLLLAGVESAGAIVQAALAHGAADNVTTVLVDTMER